MRRRTDSNHAQIVKDARELGCTVADTSSLGHGFPDLVLGINGRNYLVEVKDGSKPPSKRSLTEDEKAWHASWKGQVVVVESVENLIAFLQRRK